MIARDDLSAYLRDYLDCDNFNDYAPNGIQVEGVSSITRICTAVTASEGIINTAIAMKADAILTHHGYFWRGEDANITGIKRRRIGALINHNMNLFAYHLPLDSHPVVGNNACLANLFGFTQVQRHSAGKHSNLLWSGTLKKPLSAEELSALINKKLNRAPLCVSGTDKLISRVAWCSGGAQVFIDEALQLGVDAYLSGEISERTFYQAEELGLHYFACGHHATERYGIQALGKHLSQIFSLEHHFIDSNNPV